MDYICDGIQMEIEHLDPKEKNCRLLMYYRKIQALVYEKEKHNKKYEEKKFANGFWNKESEWEQKIYGVMKAEEKRHPIMGIVFCTVLSGILVSVVAGIILEAILICI